MGDVQQQDFPAVLRPAFARFFGVGWNIGKNFTHVLCQLTFGAAIPSGGLVLQLPVPAILGILLFATTSFAFLMDLPMWGIVNYVYAWAVYGIECVASVVSGKWPREWIAMWGLTFFLTFLCSMCARVGSSFHVPMRRGCLRRFLYSN